MGSGPGRNRRLLWLAALALAHSTAWGAQGPGVTPAYVARRRPIDATIQYN